MNSDMDRRSFISRAGATVAVAAAGAGLRPAVAAAAGKPNILVIMVDEMRAPQWFPDQKQLDALLPNIARIRSSAVSFESHYTAANMCTPARGALVTGLYPHQTGCMLTNQSTLSAGFPTWGTMLRQFGYRSNWYGKWHLGNVPDTQVGGLEAYGFDGGTYPSPNGGPGQGLQADPGIADQFVDWISHAGSDQPFCSTVSFVNPHDIQWWPRLTKIVELQQQIPSVFAGIPPNFETADELRRNKPGLQSALLDISQITFGLIGYGTDSYAQWARLRDLYLWFQQQVDKQIGRVLDALDARPDIASNTVVIFTSDHGDYAGSHGLHGKGGGVYEEGIKVPLYVDDHRKILSRNNTETRQQLTSSIDMAPFLLSIAAGGNGWRTDPQYDYLSGRGDIMAVCLDPGAPGRQWIAHVTDEHSIEEAAVVFAGSAPAHVLAVRTATSKFAVYSHWDRGTTRIDAARGQDFELYDYAEDHGTLELDNLATTSGLRPALEKLHEDAAAEVDAPVPQRLLAAQEQGLADYYRLENGLAAFN